LVPAPLGRLGWDSVALETVTHGDRLALAYLMPDFHNPTGLVMEAALRRRVVRGLERAGALMIIDETFVELNLDGVPVPAPAASFGEGHTITIGSLSKSIWGGLRVGWARADARLIHRMATVRAASDLASPLFEQIVAAYALERLDEILAERRELIRTRRAALARALDELLPAWSYALPPGGLFLWAELPSPISTSLALEASRHDLYLTPGPRFAAAGLLERYLRLPFTLAPDQLERVVEILAELTPARRAVRAPRALAGYVA
jgi:DNA-binding transcriptional MocR family regulator